MKAIAITTSPIMLIDPQTRQILTHDKPSLITWTQFLEARTGKGEIKILASNVPDEADANEFDDYLKEAENVDLAVAAFMSSFEEKEEEAPKPKGKAKTKAAETKPAGEE